ncbi:HU family DNA-binding protein [Psychroflexus sp. CAK8W]|uniref:HU family DNA-binding protein n=1 Tax=Psychroflexus longus TaxID=2873596 RepID=A0ABS7XKG5_9FLAO|nr:HU family DNA-binding protein [Psychroflexus longus]MBZ9779443.1 HU family DNA-binding protein [Psychroflexus longus]
MIQVKSLQRVNPRDVEAPKKFYVQAVSAGKTDLDRLAYLISNQSTVRKADCYAVLEALLHNMMDELREGRIIELGNIGNFQIGVSSDAVETEEEVTSGLVRKARISFRPAKALRDLLQTVDYKKVS